MKRDIGFKSEFCMKEKKLKILLISIILISGCASVNQGLDKANEGSKEIGKPVGKLMNIPASVMRGGAEGIKSKEKDPEKERDPENPFNR